MMFPLDDPCTINEENSSLSEFRLIFPLELLKSPVIFKAPFLAIVTAPFEIVDKSFVVAEVELTVTVVEAIISTSDESEGSNS